jgi:hypothetical protein
MNMMPWGQLLLLPLPPALLLLTVLLILKINGSDVEL